MRIAVSRTRPPRLVDDLAGLLPVRLEAMGSAGAKTAAVLSGAVDAYVHAGGQYEWDSAAPVAVVLAAGAVATRLDGTSLRYNDSSAYLPDLLVCLPRVRDTLSAALARLGRA